MPNLPGPANTFVMGRAFICYAREDAVAARVFYDLLSRYRPEISPWMDESLPGSDYWQRTIQRALEEAQVLLVFVSAHILPLECYCHREIGVFLRLLSQEPARRVIPVWLDPSCALPESIAEFQAIVCNNWNMDADIVVRTTVVPLVVGHVPHPEAVRPPHPLVDLTISVAAAMAKKASSAAEHQDLIRWMMLFCQLDSLSADQRSQLLGAAADVAVRQGDWPTVASIAAQALAHLDRGQGAGGQDASLLIGGMFCRLALARSRLGDPSCVAAWDSAEAALLRVRDPLIRATRLGGLFRDLGDQHLHTGRLQDAAAAYADSKLALAEMPSERWHWTQADIRGVQVSLLLGQVSAAETLLATVARRFEEDGYEHDVRDIVRSHFLFTTGALALARRNFGAALRAFDSQRRYANAKGFANEKKKALLASLLVPFLWWLPPPYQLRGFLWAHSMGTRVASRWRSRAWAIPSPPDSGAERCSAPRQ